MAVVIPRELELRTALHRAPYDVPGWLRLVAATSAAFDAQRPGKPNQRSNAVNAAYLEALAECPKSYKLWHAYLTERRSQLFGKDVSGRPVLRFPVDGPQVVAAVTEHQRALQHAPYLRLFLDLATLQRDVLADIRGSLATISLALAVLPRTQHGKLWAEGVRPLTVSVAVPTTVAVELSRRMLQFRPKARGAVLQAHLDHLALLDERQCHADLLAHCAHCAERFPALRTNDDFWARAVKCLAESRAAAAGVTAESLVRVEALVQLGLRYAPTSMHVALVGGHARLLSQLGDFPGARRAFAAGLAAAARADDTARYHALWLLQAAAEEELARLVLRRLPDDLTKARAVVSTVLGPVAEVAGCTDTDSLKDTVVSAFARRASAYDTERRRAWVEASPSNAAARLEYAAQLIIDRAPRAEIHAAFRAGIQAALAAAAAARAPRRDNAGADASTAAPAAARPAHLFAAYAAWVAQGEPAGPDEAAPAGDAVAKATALLHRAAVDTALPAADTTLLLCTAAELHLTAGPHPTRGAMTAALRTATEGAAIARASERLSAAAATPLHDLRCDLLLSLGRTDDAVTALREALTAGAASLRAAVAVARALHDGHPEEAYQLLERALASFPPQTAATATLYTAYLDLFTAGIDGAGAAKVERARDLFDAALAAWPTNRGAMAACLLRYAQFEETHGSTAAACELYMTWATDPAAAPLGPRPAAAIAALLRLGGLTVLRRAAPRLLSGIPRAALCQRGLLLLAAEEAAGETDRCRAMFADLCPHEDPAPDTSGLWRAWRAFEVRHGTLETFEGMERRKRTVATEYAKVEVVFEADAERLKAAPVPVTE